MKYTVEFKCLSKPNQDLIHHCNDYDQAEHFYWAMVVELKGTTEHFVLTLFYNNFDNKIDAPHPRIKMQFTKTDI